MIALGLDHFSDIAAELGSAGGAFQMDMLVNNMDAVFFPQDFISYGIARNNIAFFI